MMQILVFSIALGETMRMRMQLMDYPWDTDQVDRLESTWVYEFNRRPGGPLVRPPGHLTGDGRAGSNTDSLRGGPRLRSGETNFDRGKLKETLRRSLDHSEKRKGIAAGLPRRTGNIFGNDLNAEVREIRERKEELKEIKKKIAKKKTEEIDVGDADLCSCLVPSVCHTQSECAKLGQGGERNSVISLLASKGVGSVKDLQAMQNIDLGKKCRSLNLQLPLKIEAHF